MPYSPFEIKNLILNYNYLYTMVVAIYFYISEQNLLKYFYIVLFKGNLTSNFGIVSIILHNEDYLKPCYVILV